MLAPLLANCGRGARICPPLRFDNLRQIRLGSNSCIHRDCWLQVIRGFGDEQCVKIDIGDLVAIGMGATISAAQSITLKNGVMLARNVYISDHSHAYEDISRPIMRQGITGVAPVIIGQNTWLGQNVVVLPGSPLGSIASLAQIQW